MSAVRAQGHAAVPVADFDVDSAALTARVAYFVTGDGQLARRRTMDEATRDEVLTDELRWQPYGQPLDGLGEISKQEADSFVERKSSDTADES